MLVLVFFHNLSKTYKNYVQYLNFKFQAVALVFLCQIQQVFFCLQAASVLSPQFRTNIMRNTRLLGIFALAFITTFNTKECLGQSESLLRVGKAINVFIRYGYLSISMKVISYNDTERWIFKEPTKNIFQVSGSFKTRKCSPMKI